MTNMGFLTAATALNVIRSAFKFLHIKSYIKRLTKILSDETALEIKL